MVHEVEHSQEGLELSWYDSCFYRRGSRQPRPSQGEVELGEGRPNDEVAEKPHVQGDLVQPGAAYPSYLASFCADSRPRREGRELPRAPFAGRGGRRTELERQLEQWRERVLRVRGERRERVRKFVYDFVLTWV